MKRFWLLSGLLVGAVLFALTLRHVDLGQSLEALRGIDPRYALLVLASAVTFLYFKTWRWSLLLSPLIETRVTELAPAVCAGTAANLIVPHAGEFARALMVRDRRGETVAVSALLASIAIERLFDFVAVLVLFAVVFVVQTGLPDAVIYASLVAAGFSVALMGVALLILYRSAAVLRVLENLLRIFPARVRAFVLKHAESGIAGLGSLRHASLLAKIGCASLLQWSMVVVVIFASVKAVGPVIAPAAAITVLTLLVAGFTLPAAPMYVGTVQVAFALGLGAFRIDAATAVAASVVYMTFCMLPMLLIGAVYLYRRGLGPGSLPNVP